MAGFHIGESTGQISVMLGIAHTLKNRPEYFREGVKIASFFGSPVCAWNGGRTIGGNFRPDLIQMAINTYNDLGIPYRFTFTNPHITEELLEDRRGNFLLNVCDNGMNEVIVNSPLLEEYIRKTHPEIKLTSSTCKCIRSIEGVKEELKKDYSLVVLDYNFNDKQEELEKLTPDERKRCEMLVNTFCVPDCPRRAAHYDHIGKEQIYVSAELEKMGMVTEEDMRNLPGFKGWECEWHARNPYEQKGSPLRLEPDDIYNGLVPMGFDNFKLEGRASNIMLVADEAARYMAKPESFDKAVYEIMAGATENLDLNYF